MSAFNPEDSLLAVLMARNEAYWQVCEIVCPQDFSPKARKLYEAIAEQIRDNQPADVVTLADKLGDALGLEALDIASNCVGSLANVATYAKLVSERGEAKRVREAGERIAHATSYTEAQALLAEVRPQQSARLKSATDGLREMMDALQRRFEADGEVSGVPTGLESLDHLTGGWQAGDLVGIGGATSSGKTAFALQAAIAAGRCYYVSLEMMTSQLMERAVCNVGNIAYRNIRFPKDAPEHELGRLYDAVAKAKELPLIIDDQPGLTVEQIGARARQLHMQQPLTMVVVDHLNLVRRPRKNDAAELGEVAIALKNLAKELGVPVMVLVQLNRGNNKRNDRRPLLDDFRNSGEIEEALDTAVMVYRDEYYEPHGPLAGYAEFIVRKQRQGERDVTAWAKSYLAQMRFESTDEPERSAGQAEGNDGRGGFAARFRPRGQSTAMAAAGGDR